MRDRRARAQGSAGDGFTQAVEFASGPVLLGLLGWFLDSRLGTAPLFLVGLACFGVVGAFVTFYFRYQAISAREDEGKPWTRRQW